MDCIGLRKDIYGYIGLSRIWGLGFSSLKGGIWWIIYRGLLQGLMKGDTLFLDYGSLGGSLDLIGQILEATGFPKFPF